MSYSTSDVLTLASLPSDIIRMIIQINKGKCMESARTVSRVWNNLISEFMKTLPPVESVFLIFDSAYNLVTLDIEIETEHLRHFECILPKDWTIREEITELRNLRRISQSCIGLRYERQLQDTSLFLLLSHLFQTTNQIDFVSFDGFDEKLCTNVRKTMRNVNIHFLEICNTKYDLDMRKIIREMIRLHQVYHLIIQNHTFYRDELCEICNIIPISTPNVSVVVSNHNGMTPQEFQEYCNSLGKFLVEKKGKALAKFVSAPTLVCEKGEPFLMFMRIFLEYDLF